MNTSRPGIPRRVAGLLVAAALAGGSLSLAGCSDASEATSAPGPEPAVVEELSEDLAQLTLTTKAVERLGLETVQVEQDGDGLTVPYAALIYDHNGDTWVYMSPEPEVFVRAAVVVDRIDGEVVHLSEGPVPGTSVVTLGAAELFGAEFDTAH